MARGKRRRVSDVGRLPPSLAQPLPYPFAKQKRRACYSRRILQPRLDKQPRERFDVDLPASFSTVVQRLSAGGGVLEHFVELRRGERERVSAALS